VTRGPGPSFVDQRMTRPQDETTGKRDMLNWSTEPSRTTVSRFASVMLAGVRNSVSQFVTSTA